MKPLSTKKKLTPTNPSLKKWVLKKAVYYVAVCTENHYGEYKP